MSAAPAHPFDGLAADYDRLWTDSLPGTLERQAVWRALERLIRPGQCVLDIGCGTGADAVHLARRGVRVQAMDASAEMVEMTRARLTREGVDHLVTTGRLSAEALPPSGAFDGALLNFGVLNCIADLPALAKRLAGALRPGAWLALCFMGRFYLGETLRFALRRDAARAMRRWKRGPVIASIGGASLPVYYRSAASIRAAFEPQFRLVRHQGIGILVPLAGWLPSVAALRALDQLLGRCPGWRAIGDHQLMILVRKA